VTITAGVIFAAACLTARIAVVGLIILAALMAVALAQAVAVIGTAPFARSLINHQELYLFLRSASTYLTRLARKAASHLAVRPATTTGGE